jgi:hypothetical protein
VRKWLSDGVAICDVLLECGEDEKPVKPRKPKDNCPTSENAKRIADMFQRRHTTPWTKKEITAFKAAQPMQDEDLTMLETYYKQNGPPGEGNFLRRDLQTFLNNYASELDRARNSRTESPSRTMAPGTTLNGIRIV